MDYKKIIKSRKARELILNSLYFIPDKTMIKLQYRIKTGRKLNLNKPIRYSEKMQLYKLYYREPLMRVVADKASVKQYITEQGFGDVVIPTIGVYDAIAVSYTHLNWMSTVGENINEVERLACETVGCKHAVALATGTSALHLAVKLAGIKPGEKVFCSDMTFSATVNPVVYEGGVPVFIDTEYDTWNMDPVALEKAFELYPEVRGVVMAHLYGTPGKIDELRAVCERHGAMIIEEMCIRDRRIFLTLRQRYGRMEL